MQSSKQNMTPSKRIEWEWRGHVDLFIMQSKSELTQFHFQKKSRETKVGKVYNAYNETSLDELCSLDDLHDQRRKKCSENHPMIQMKFRTNKGTPGEYLEQNNS